VVPGVKYALVNNSNFDSMSERSTGSLSATSLDTTTASLRTRRLPSTTALSAYTAGSFQSKNAYRLGNSAGAIGGIEWSHNITKNWASLPVWIGLRARAATLYFPGLDSCTRATSLSVPAT